ncbi:MAG TPA: hypothetical protein VHI77_02360 [Solirubrobacterales bacterium]|nr:hypothetical protein [Solirubrobacterales bacterium]
MIDFATLGEYGLEPVENARRNCEARPHRETFKEVLFPNQCGPRL